VHSNGSVSRRFGVGCEVDAGYLAGMHVDWSAEVVDQVESHWRHQLRPRLDGLTDDEYFWQPIPGCWTVSRRRSSAAPRSLGGGDFTWDYGDPRDGEAVTTEEALRQFDDAFAHWIEGVRGLGEAGLTSPQGPTSPPEFADAPMVRLILYTSVEVIHHGAEVCILGSP
jgi:hypothetical protein